MRDYEPLKENDLADLGPSSPSLSQASSSSSFSSSLEDGEALIALEINRLVHTAMEAGNNIVRLFSPALGYYQLMSDEGRLLADRPDAAGAIQTYLSWYEHFDGFVGTIAPAIPLIQRKILFISMIQIASKQGFGTESQINGQQGFYLWLRKQVVDHSKHFRVKILLIILASEEGVEKTEWFLSHMKLFTQKPWLEYDRIAKMAATTVSLSAFQHGVSEYISCHELQLKESVSRDVIYLRDTATSIPENQNGDLAAAEARATNRPKRM